MMFLECHFFSNDIRFSQQFINNTGYAKTIYNIGRKYWKNQPPEGTVKILDIF